MREIAMKYWQQDTIIQRLLNNSIFAVIPAKAGIHSPHEYWIPVFTGMTMCLFFRSLIQ